LSACAEICRVSPTLLKEPVARETETLTTGAMAGSTVKLAEAEKPASAACTWVVSMEVMARFATTVPLAASMLAMAGSSTVQAAEPAPGMGCPLASSAWAVKVKETAGPIDCDPGLTVTLSGIWATTTVSELCAEPEVAVIAALPFFTAVTRPFASTTATVLSALLQETVAPGTTAPAASLAEALSCRVAPSAFRTALPLAWTLMVATEGWLDPPQACCLLQEAGIQASGRFTPDPPEVC
jgi:hypothetical protein